MKEKYVPQFLAVAAIDTWVRSRTMDLKVGGNSSSIPLTGDRLFYETSFRHVFSDLTKIFKSTFKLVPWIIFSTNL